MPFRFENGEVPGVVRIEPRVFQDARGFFLEFYKQSEFAKYGLPDFVQGNHSLSSKGTLRGLHFQRDPEAQGKLVHVVRGEIFDVAVDLREGAPSFGRWEGAGLSAENHRMLYIPPGCAHGFCVLSDEAEVMYATTAEYARDLEGGVVWNDPDLAIDWPITKPSLSERDERLPRLRDAAAGFVFRQP